MKSKLLEFSVVALIIGLLCELANCLRISIHDNGGAAGASAPVELPRESRRCHHRQTGSSVVLPTNWEFAHNLPWLAIFAHTPFGRTRASIDISPVDPPTKLELSRCKKTIHGKWPAHEVMSITRLDTLDDAGRSRYSRLVQTDVGWWQINYSFRGESVSLPDGVRRFLDTVRFPSTPPEKTVVTKIDLPTLQSRE